MIRVKTSEVSHKPVRSNESVWCQKVSQCSVTDWYRKLKLPQFNKTLTCMTGQVWTLKKKHYQVSFSVPFWVLVHKGGKSVHEQEHCYGFARWFFFFFLSCRLCWSGHVVPVFQMATLTLTRCCVTASLATNKGGTTCTTSAESPLGTTLCLTAGVDTFWGLCFLLW